MPSRRCWTSSRFAPASPTLASSLASDPGRAEQRVKTTRRRPASVSWWRADPAGRRRVAARDLGEQAGVDVAAAEDDGGRTLGGNRGLVAEEGGDADRARA